MFRGGDVWTGPQTGRTGLYMFCVSMKRILTVLHYHPVSLYMSLTCVTSFDHQLTAFKPVSSHLTSQYMLTCVLIGPLVTGSHVWALSANQDTTGTNKPREQLQAQLNVSHRPKCFRICLHKVDSLKSAAYQEYDVHERVGEFYFIFLLSRHFMERPLSTSISDWL